VANVELATVADCWEGVGNTLLWDFLHNRASVLDALYLLELQYLGVNCNYTEYILGSSFCRA
jgi:hypothetical protein